MKDDTSIFGAEPDRLDRLVFYALGPSEEEDKAVPTASLDAILEHQGTQIGRYRLVRILGEGGMGIVHLAEQQQPIVRQVALKVIKPGMDSKRVIARFEAERQALALLDHPNIARVHDAGTTESGRPYFVMEYVQGVPVTTYCDRHKFTVEHRLGLFLQVCHAVHHAHQKGIIHRDIKPSNILVAAVDGQAVPKIIDFGIAKAMTGTMTDSTLFTEQGQLIGTPEYMSPEQADATCEDVDTRSDIYSLGVVLYQLLTGVLPFDSAKLRQGGIDYIRRVLCEENPKTPSTRFSGLGKEAEAVAQQRKTDVSSLTQRLHRELEWIPLKALRKDRTRRYRSAAEFADDIANYLQGSPLIAGPESLTYWAGKFVRRHRVPVLAAGSIAVALILATLVSIVLYVQAVNATESHRRLLYVNQIALAHSACHEADIDRAKSLLANCPADLRGFAWSYLWRLCTVVPATPSIKHADPINAIAFSPKSESLATASSNTVRLWNASTHNLTTTLNGHTGTVKAIAFSADGAMLVSGGTDRAAVLWDMATRKEIATLILPKQTGPITAVSLAFSGDAQTIAVVFDAQESGPMVVLWDVDSKASVQLTQEGAADKRVFSVAFSPDSTLLAVTGVQKTTLWNIPTRQSVILKGDLAFVNSALFLPDGKTLVTTGNDGTLRFWDLAAQNTLKALSARAPVLSMAISPNGATLATGSVDNTIRLWDTAERREISQLKGHKSDVRCLAFSTDGTVLASASKDGTVKLWDLAAPPDLNTLRGHNRIVNGIVFSPDSRRLVSTSYKGDPPVKMWDVTSGRDLSADLGDPTHNWSTCVDLSSDGNVLAIGTRDLELWNMTTKRPMGTLAHGRVGRNILQAVFSPNGKTLATQTGGSNLTLRLWDTSTWKELISLQGYGSQVGALAFSPDGRTLAVPHNSDLTVALWDTSNLCAGCGEDPVVRLTGHRGPINAVAFSPDGAILASGGNDTTIRLSDLSMRHETVILTGHTSDIYSLSFSPDGRTLASGGNDGTVRLWNLVLHEQVAVLDEHGSAIWDVAFSPDGHTLASSSFDSTIRLWRAATDLEIQDIPTK